MDVDFFVHVCVGVKSGQCMWKRWVLVELCVFSKMIMTKGKRMHRTGGRDGEKGIKESEFLIK